MKTSCLKKYVVEIISFLFLILFTYAAFSKLASYESFTIQLGQSPLLSAFAGWVAWFIPALEIVIALLLMFSRTRFFALTASFTLMTMFTAYIFIILNYSEFVPSSCGGILEKMTWQQHIYFNIVFCFLAAVAIILSLEKLPMQTNVWKIKYKLILLFISTLFAVGIVIVLFIKSEQIIHQENNFVRRYPPYLYNKAGQIDLKYGGFYFAGVVNDTIYLGNFAAPLTVLAISSNLKFTKQYKIQIDNYSLPFNGALVRVQPPYFFLTDDTIPCIFRGNTNTWTAKQLKGNKTYFSVFEPIDSITAAIRTRKPKTKESVLAKLIFSEKNNQLIANDKLLQKQIDGVFDCDGMLRYNPGTKTFVYTYFYRNEFIVTDGNLNISYRGNTIDTTKVAKLKIASLANGARKLAAPPLMVNKLSTVSGNQLFVNSKLRGRYESSKLWKQSSVIDVYNLNTKTYDYSFYVHNLDKVKPQAMFAYKNFVYFIFDNELVAYKYDGTVRQ